ncbi:alanine:cation symporter family protein [Luteolibacter pohnpeiensis]|uniref:Alanine:cation symporter family protein n=1 Tax=Luteolibacter pohnpeiensis TaxID=454153 RepID=A0A934VTS0_9BACT|nr:alanine/glycine:cation symporter family protein [Luteolibacter pohnpeiensis]MBK1881767.1 alanine:cation symporter family protein [Luteolibacter pohnpeiensis]
MIQRLCRSMVSRLTFLALFLFTSGLASAAEVAQPERLDAKIDKLFGKTTGWFVDLVFTTVPINGYQVFLVVLWLALAGFALTLFFKFINLRAFGLAIRTVRGKYSTPDDPGQITHFQALTAAVSGTVGLGNIAGVAIGIMSGGPGVAFWLFLAGFLGMATKFAECTLGVKYRDIDKEGQIHGGAMYYLPRGFKDQWGAGFGVIGKGLAFIFAICCVFASFGGGNVFQINQTVNQLINVTGGETSFFAAHQWVFGLIMAVVTGLVIIGGIQGIARITDKLVPAMCIIYVLSSVLVLIVNRAHIVEALSMIITEAFHPRPAVTGGLVAVFVWGLRRATFSNEAGIGSAPIAHSSAKTRMPASEGVVALLEPFLDTVVVCTMTSLVLVTTMYFKGDSGDFVINGQQFTLAAGHNDAFGIGMTSLAFESVHSGFQYILFMCVLLFAFSTLITWSYYGLQAWQFIFGRQKIVELIYKLLFCLIIIAGSAASVSKVIDFSDASLFAMSVPNLIGVYFLLPVVVRELGKFVRFSKRIDDGATVEESARIAQTEG